jgi:DNA-binding NarL/FixJ family response regulator
MVADVGVADAGTVPRLRTVLIVDDSAVLRRTLASYLSHAGGWEAVLTASDAGSGLLLAAMHCPDAIVLDNRMPGGDGIDVLHDLRRTCPAARIVMHTTEDSSGLRERANELGADAVVAKGHPLNDLVTLLA